MVVGGTPAPVDEELAESGFQAEDFAVGLLEIRVGIAARSAVVGHVFDWVMAGQQPACIEQDCRDVAEHLPYLGLRNQVADESIAS